MWPRYEKLRTETKNGGEAPCAENPGQSRADHAVAVGGLPAIRPRYAHPDGCAAVPRVGAGSRASGRPSGPFSGRLTGPSMPERRSEFSTIAVCLLVVGGYHLPT
jgi:hypothetical protein